MSDTSKETGIFGQLFGTFFSKHWPVWVGGITLGLLNIILFSVHSPWGASGGINNWGENIYKVLGFSAYSEAASTGTSLFGMLCIMLVLGSFLGALFSKEFAFRIPPKGEMVKGFIGGGLMALGATIGLGCTIGSFFSGVPALSGGALIFTIGLFVGVILALKYLMWEMEHYPQFSSGKSYTLFAVKPGKGSWQVYIGWILFAAVLLLAWWYSSFNPIMTWFVIIGLFMGLICQRSRFCIVKAFRDPFMTGESDGSVGVMAGLIITLIGFTAIKYFGIGISGAELRAREMAWVFPHFWGRALLGGFIFGLGMTVAGGCAVGTLWRVGEGQVKLWLAALGFVLLSPLSNRYIVPTVNDLFPQELRYRSFLPDYIGYPGAVALVIGIILLWYWFVKWNEKTGKFTAY
ncbi:MAG: YeeE/YedE family protein [Bacteroidales bacterium]|nr:YeeE/YedE family protein [Bacteroidales bacterium]